MKRIFILLLFLTSCSISVKPTHEYDVVYNPKYASRFKLLSHGDSLFLSVKNPWQGAQDQQMYYYLTGNAHRIICMSSSHTAFIDAFGESDKVIGVSGAKFIFNPTHQNKPDIGHDNAISYEQILALKSDLMTVYEINGENTKQTDKLQELGINVVHIADYLEESPLGRAEWIVAFGAMLGRQKEAIIIFDSIESRYNKAKQNSSTTNIQVMLNSPYKDVWYMPGDSSYMVKLINDAGGVYLGSGVAEAKSRPISIETAYSMLLKADIWLNPSGHITTVEQLKTENARLNGINIPVYSNIKRNTGAGGSDFWESGVTNPDLILIDLQRIFKMRRDVSNDSLYYFKQLR